MHSGILELGLDRALLDQIVELLYISNNPVALF